MDLSKLIPAGTSRFIRTMGIRALIKCWSQDERRLSGRNMEAAQAVLASPPMAMAEFDPLYESLRAKIGGLVFNGFADRIVITRAPTFVGQWAMI